MSTRKLETIHVNQIKRGMLVQVTYTWPSGATQVTEGRVHSIGNYQTVLLGDAESFVEVVARHADATTTWHRILELPEEREAVVLVKQPDGKLQALVCDGGERWLGPGSVWSPDEVMAQLERVLWDGEQ